MGRGGVTLAGALSTRPPPPSLLCLCGTRRVAALAGAIERHLADGRRGEIVRDGIRCVLQLGGPVSFCVPHCARTCVR